MYRLRKQFLKYSMMSVVFKNGQNRNQHVIEDIPSPTSMSPFGHQQPESKVGCIFPVVISSEFRLGQYRDDDHREDALHCNNLSIRQQ